MSGGEWSTGAGVYTEHGNHTQPNTCSQTLIIITTTVMVEQLLILSLDVCLDTVIVGVVSFTLTM